MRARLKIEAMQTISDIIKRVRLGHGLTQTEIAQKVGVDQATISRWERGVGDSTVAPNAGLAIGAMLIELDRKEKRRGRIGAQKAEA